MKDLIIGSHVSMNKPGNYLLGALKDTIANDANAMMIYTGPPQNTIRVDTSNFFIEEFHAELKSNNLSLDNVIIHAPYIINLGNSINLSTFEIAVEFLKKEIKRAEEIGVKIIVLHPGSAVGAERQVGLDQIVKGLNLVLTKEQTVKIALETMAGKGSELGINFDELKYIIDNVNFSEKLGVCWDTCHMHDAGYDFENDLDKILAEFNNKIGLDNLLCLHINDSKNPINNHKDRHENIGYGFLGFETLINIIYHPLLDGKIKILETPYVGDKATAIPPYQAEIAMIKAKSFTDPFHNLNKVKVK
ncbi:endonuclease IV [Spiroplasma syrphidicola EA-1]|uniref:Probable endonuclease 4 n=1 Tax=Spiroplasma syrphidicola EA-1 TaxID=1276229 RepID=R4UL83_9MOLU|nr:deoxyribonuclease IV [Spiroplasma syrphidicola]AGM26021.1 endonuclease IV [Spiroplasma syrphidicola EA-1]